jgi:selenocysteine-specific translation elongation factor
MNKETLRMQMLAGIITEGQYKVKLNENESAKPIEITVELTNKFKEKMKESKNTEGNKGFHSTDSKIKLYNNGDRYNLVKVGTIPYDVKRDLQFDFWASYRPKADEIYVNQSNATAKDLENSLLKDDSIPSTAGIVSKLEPGYYCKFENGFNVGEEDSRGYFKIVDVK